MPLDYGAQYQPDKLGCPTDECTHGSAVHRTTYGRIMCFVPGCVCGREI